MLRKHLVIDKIYREEESGQFFRSPDGVGCYWYGTLEEAKEDLGYDPTYQVTVTNVIRLED